MSICLGLSVVAGAIGLAAIVGAFLAGMAFSETRRRWELHVQFDPVYHLLVPFFFVVTGARVDPGVLVDPSTAGLVTAVTALAIIDKLVGCGGASWGLGARSMWIIGVGMVPRGEVGLIVASVGLNAGIIGRDLYGVVVAMSILTTLVTPPVLKLLVSRRPPADAPRERRLHDATRPASSGSAASTRRCQCRISARGSPATSSPRTSGTRSCSFC